MTVARHVIFGTGAIGVATLAALARRGVSVRLINRSGRIHLPAGIEQRDVDVVAGDAADPAFATEVSRDAAVVYQTMNPPYHERSERFPALQAGVIAAARSHGARLVSMENVYLYGRPNGRVFTEQSPHEAHTKKGMLRGRMSRELLELHQAGDVEVAIGRASDYFGPGGGAQSNLGDRLFPPALAGRSATVLGSPDQPHSYTFIPDIGEALAVLGEHPDAAGQAWHLPNDPITRSTRELIEIAYRLAGRSKARIRQLPGWTVRAAGLVDRTLRELPEMAYQFEEPFTVDSQPIATRLGVTATPAEEALERTLATYSAGGRQGPSRVRQPRGA